MKGINEMYCSKCGARIGNGSQYCTCCGARIGAKHTPRRWVQYQAEDVSLDSLDQWLKIHSDIEIESVRANFRYRYYGFSNWNLEWYMPFISIRYYPNTPGHKYHLTWASSGERLFESGAKRVHNIVSGNLIGAKKVVFKKYHHAHYDRGGDLEMHFEMAIYEEY